MFKKLVKNYYTIDFLKILKNKQKMSLQTKIIIPYKFQKRVEWIYRLTGVAIGHNKGWRHSLRVRIKAKRLNLRSNKKLQNFWIKVRNRFKWRGGYCRNLVRRRSMKEVCRAKQVGDINNLWIIQYCRIN